jgi:hypothetical protein
MGMGWDVSRDWSDWSASRDLGTWRDLEGTGRD